MLDAGRVHLRASRWRYLSAGAASASAAATAFPFPPSSCPAGYHPSPTGGKCYKHLSGNLNPAQCMARCHAEQATLPCVGNAQENSALISLVGMNERTCGPSSQAGCIWIGLRQTITTGGAGAHWDAWDSISTQTCTSAYRNWNPGEPNDWGGSGAGSGDENCAFIGWSGNSHWFDGPARLPSRVCEKNDAPPTGDMACFNTCRYALDGDCDDGGHGSEYTACTACQDCNDCGPRPVGSCSASPPPPPPPPPPTDVGGSCPSGYSSHGSKCYKRQSGTFTPATCMASCHVRVRSSRALQARPRTTLSSPSPVRMLALAALTSQRNCVWIGLRQTITTGGSAAHWDAWDGSCTSTYRHWQPGEPNDWGGSGAGSGDENCAFIGFSGSRTWYDGPCSMQAACICEHTSGGSYPPAPPRLSSPPPPHPFPSVTCRAGYRVGPTGKCYGRPASPVGTPADCMSRCHAEGAHLPCVANEAENHFLYDQVGTNQASCGFTTQRNCVWIGLRQTVTTQGSDAHWDAWDDFGPTTTCTSTYRHWQPGEPNDYGSSGAGSGDENCAFIGFNGAQTPGSTARARCGPRVSVRCPPDLTRRIHHRRHQWRARPATRAGRPEKCYKRLPSTGTPAQCMAPATPSRRPCRALRTRRKTMLLSPWPARMLPPAASLRSATASGSASVRRSRLKAPVRTGTRGTAPVRRRTVTGSRASPTTGAARAPARAMRIAPSSALAALAISGDGPKPMQAACICEQMSVVGGCPPAPPPPPPPPPPNPFPPVV